MTPRQIRRAEELIARRAARKAGFPATQTTVTAAVSQILETPAKVDTLAAVAAASSVFVEAEHETTISAARLAANRANGALSKGALSPTTKAICAQNHTIHGLARHQNGAFKLLGSEDPIAFEALKQSLFDEHLPATTTESILVNSMAESNWLSSRAQRLQDTCMNSETGDITDKDKFNIYMRYQTTHTRAFHKSLNDLAKLRNDRRKAHVGVEAQEMKKEAHAAELLKKEAQTNYQISRTVEKIAWGRQNIRKYDEQYEALRGKTTSVNDEIKEKAEAA